MQMAVGQSGKHRKAIVLIQLKRFFLPWQKVSYGTMAAEYALRFTSGAGRESDVRRIVGSDYRCGFAVGE